MVWPLRVSSYSKIWMPLLGAYIVLVLRALVMQGINAKKGVHGPTDISTLLEDQITVAEPV